MEIVVQGKEIVEMTAKKLISLRISKATEDKLRWLAERHGTQTEAVAVGIDRLYESDYNKERPMDKMDGADLYQLFAQDAAFGDIAEQPLAEIVEGIAELRAGTDCDIPMSDWEIAVAIRENARQHIRKQKPYPFPIDRLAAKAAQ